LKHNSEFYHLFEKFHFHFKLCNTGVTTQELSQYLSHQNLFWLSTLFDRKLPLLVNLCVLCCLRKYFATTITTTSKSEWHISLVLDVVLPEFPPRRRGGWHMKSRRADKHLRTSILIAFLSSQRRQERQNRPEKKRKKKTYKFIPLNFFLLLEETTT